MTIARFPVWRSIMPQRLEDLLFALEEQFWLKSADYYQRNLADAALMVFPGPAGVQVKDEILSSVASAARWSDVALEEHRVMELSSGLCARREALEARLPPAD